MELVLAISVGVVFGAGIWLILRPRTFQLITGLLLMSYARGTCSSSRWGGCGWTSRRSRPRPPSIRRSSPTLLPQASCSPPS